MLGLSLNFNLKYSRNDYIAILFDLVYDHTNNRAMLLHNQLEDINCDLLELELLQNLFWLIFK